MLGSSRNPGTGSREPSAWGSLNPSMGLKNPAGLGSSNPHL
ncbi:hypothetical protein SLEP1_g60345, partial [Rubroshorea leprosula]